MNDYQQYTAEEFLQDTWFLAWVKHGQPEARQFWEKWQREHPYQRETLLLAKDMAEALKNRPHNLSPGQEQLEIEQIVKLTRHVPERSPWAGFSASFSSRRWLAAAIALLVLGAGWGVFLVQDKANWSVAKNALTSLDDSTDDHWVKQVNGMSQPVSLTLPDGSRMTLMPNSEARYPRTFEADQREVQLKGDAVFSVVHEGKRPFLVYSGPLVTRVLGTRFRVLAPTDGSRMKVSVLSGKVSVMDRHDWAVAQRSESRAFSGVVLTANQQVTYDATQSHYQKELVEKPVLIASSESRETFNFEDTPASGVFERLKKAYGVEIMYDPTVIRNCTLTASLSGVPLHDQLRLLCASIGATYEVVDARIIVTSKGCP
ncbi:FecR family protein [Larkinella arboricola]|uniref:FecR family protein n=1 Tax=Larkinella arboricola TaxID=643671 RepID=A0A327WP81_LARAB|nr:FecR family protein [Larkinella arboricola]RAJ94024.1 FecR family protein [Larkinella arboricola]